MISLKRVYDASSPDDGFRILADRLWPRGVSKERAKVDLWSKDTAPSNELRKWFGHEAEKWGEFRKRYVAELADNPDAVAKLRSAVKGHKKVTLLYGAKDTEHNEAVVLRDFLQGKG